MILLSHFMRTSYLYHSYSFVKGANTNAYWRQEGNLNEQASPGSQQGKMGTANNWRTDEAATSY